MPKIHALEDLWVSPTAMLFEGGDEAPVSVFVVSYERGQGPNLHVHPYPEVFVVEAGTARFTVGDRELVVEGGNILVVPAETAHGFKGAGDGVLRVVSVHPSAVVRQTLVDG